MVAVIFVFLFLALFDSVGTLKLLTGRAAEAEWLSFLFAGLFLVRYIVLI